MSECASVEGQSRPRRPAKMSTRILREKNNVRLVESTNSLGHPHYQVHTLETDTHAADVLYDGSDRSEADRVFAAATQISEIPSVLQGYIGRLLVKSPAPYRYIVYGSVRGMVSKHRTAAGAERSLAADRRGCRSLGGGAYSDARVYVIDRAGVEGWRAI